MYLLHLLVLEFTGSHRKRITVTSYQCVASFACQSSVCTVTMLLVVLLHSLVSSFSQLRPYPTGPSFLVQHLRSCACMQICTLFSGKKSIIIGLHSLYAHWHPGLLHVRVISDARVVVPAHSTCLFEQAQQWLVVQDNTPWC